MQAVANRIRGIQIFWDFCLIAIAWVIAYWIRFALVPGGQTGLRDLFVVWFVPLAALTLHFLLKNGHYDRRRLLPLANDLMQIIRANALSVVAFIVLLYFLADGRISRLTILLYAGISTTLLIFGRVMFRSFTRKLRRRGFLVQNVFVVGDSAQTEKYLKTVDYTPGTGMKVSAVFGVKPESWQGRFFPLSELERYVELETPDLVVLGINNDPSFVPSFIAKHYDQLFQIQVLVSETESLLGLSAETIEDLHVLSLNQPRFSAPEVFLKRTVDLIGSGVGLLVLSPFLMGVALAVRFGSEGPVFFGQERVGVDGQRFKMWKFRTMKPAKPGEDSTGWTVENDPRRTRVGTFLRKTSLDEFPQLWNVFVGDMSLVGPRPEQPFFVEKFRKEIPAYMLRHKMKAGITGWAQVNGWRGDTSLHKRIECDLFYIRNWTLWFDFKILLMTFIKGFINKNAY